MMLSWDQIEHYRQLAEALRKAGHRHVYKGDSCIICDRVFGK